MDTTLTLLQRLAKMLPPHVRGSLAEKVALVSYVLCGFWPQRVPQGLAQTDLTLRRGRLVLLVEVKFRATRGRGHVALAPAQHARLRRQARSVAARFEGCTVRLELCLVFLHWPYLQKIPLLAEHA